MIEYSHVVNPYTYSVRPLHLTIDDIAPHLGVSFSLLRGNRSQTGTDRAIDSPLPLSMHRAQQNIHSSVDSSRRSYFRRLTHGSHDIEAFQRLFEVRKSDLDFELEKQAAIDAVVVSRPKNFS